MQIDEHNRLIKLFDAYGNLLSSKQQEVMEKYLNCDVAESELAELLGETRQSVHDAISKAKKQLDEFEQKCGFVESKAENIKNLKKISKLLWQKKQAEALAMIYDIINKN